MRAGSSWRLFWNKHANSLDLGMDALDHSVERRRLAPRPAPGRRAHARHAELPHLRTMVLFPQPLGTDSMGEFPNCGTWFTCGFPHSESLRRIINPAPRSRGFFNATPMELSQPHTCGVGSPPCGDWFSVVFPVGSPHCGDRFSVEFPVGAPPCWDWFSVEFPNCGLGSVLGSYSLGAYGGSLIPAPSPEHVRPYSHRDPSIVTRVCGENRREKKGLSIGGNGCSGPPLPTKSLSEPET
jgi:hypothetical protein